MSGFSTYDLVEYIQGDGGRFGSVLKYVALHTYVLEYLALNPDQTSWSPSMDGNNRHDRDSHFSLSSLAPTPITIGPETPGRMQEIWISFVGTTSIFWIPPY